MCRDIAQYIQKCAVCQLYAKHSNKVEMGEMPNYPMQIIGVDLIGPFVESHRGNKYALTIVDHYNGWGEAFPIPNKKSDCFKCISQRIYPSALSSTDIDFRFRFRIHLEGMDPIHECFENRT